MINEQKLLKTTTWLQHDVKRWTPIQPFVRCPITGLLQELLPPATKLGQGYIFTGVGDSVDRGGASSQGGASSREEGASSGGCFLPWGLGGDPPGTATAAGGTHPTGMHSCLKTFNILKQSSIVFISSPSMELAFCCFKNSGSATASRIKSNYLYLLSFSPSYEKM